MNTPTLIGFDLAGGPDTTVWTRRAEDASVVVVCPDCETAARVIHHGFRANCPGCAARAVSRGPNYRRCLAAGIQDRLYRDELELMKTTHEAVRAAAAADQLNRKDNA